MVKQGPFSLSPLSQHVADIVFLCPNRKMIWLHAGRIIASMKNIHIFRYRTVMHCPGKSVSLISFFIDIKRTVSMVILRTSPFPTIFGLFNMFPKSHFWWLDLPVLRTANHTFWTVSDMLARFPAFDAFFIKRTLSHETL